MLLHLLRERTFDNATVGTLLLDNDPICDTMENSQTLIATGFYPVRLTMSPHFGMVLPLIDRVIGRTGIRIHPGNTAADSEGCVLVGEYDELLSRLMNSKRTFVQLMARLMEAQQRHEEIWIDVIDNTPATIAQNYSYDLATGRGHSEQFDDMIIVYPERNWDEPRDYTSNDQES